MSVLVIDFVRWNSGITSYALTAAESLKSGGIDVIFVTLRGKAPEALAKSRGLRTICLDSYFSLFALRKIIKDNAVEVMNAHDGKSHFLSVAAKIILGGKIRIVRTYADARAVRKHPFLWKQTDAFIAAAEFIKDDFAAKGLPPEKIRVVYQGLDAGFQKNIAPVKLKGKYNVSIVGRLDPVKGHECFIKAAAEALKKISDTCFYIVGAEKNVKIEQLQRLAEKHGVKNIVFTGFVDNVVPYMKASDIGVIASSGSEAVSRVAVEWMSCGKPLVATTAGCLGELIEDEKSGLLVEINDYKAMAEAVVSLLKNISFCENIGRAAAERARFLFGPEKFAENTEKIMKGDL